MRAYLIILLCVASCMCKESAIDKEGKNQEKRGVEGVEDYSQSDNGVHNGHAGAVSYSHVVQSHQNHQPVHHHQPVKAYTIAKEVPYPVAYEKHVPVAVKVPVPVAVDRPYPVHVPKPYPIQVIKTVPYYVEKPVHVKVPVKVEQPEYVLTKVPLVYHATYQDQPYNQGYGDYNVQSNQYQHQPQQAYNQQYQQYQPIAQVVYDRNYDEHH